MQSQTIAGAEVMQISTPLVSTGVTTEGGHLWPAKFRVGGRWIEPLSMAPWNSEKLEKSLPPILRILRGDFFCLPFGGNATALGNEKFPVHGETANRRWKCHPGEPANLHLSLRTKVRPGRVEKYVRLMLYGAARSEGNLSMIRGNPRSLALSLQLGCRGHARLVHRLCRGG